MTIVDLSRQLESIARRPELSLDLSVYDPDVLQTILDRLQSYVAQPEPASSWSRWLPWPRSAPERARVAPLLLAGPVGTGKTTLLMLLDRALPEASCAPLFQQEIPAHATTANGGGSPECIEVHPLALAGKTHNLPTGVVRLRELQTFYRLFTYDRHASRTDPAAVERFVQLFRGRVVYVDEFVPDVVTSFPMQVINLLADHGAFVVLSSNRRETPFVEGVEVVAVEGEDMRSGSLAIVCRPAGPDPRFDRFRAVPATSFDKLARGLEARLDTVGGERWMYLDFERFADVPADWLSFQQLLQHTDGVLIDRVPLFDPIRGGGQDAARRFVYLIDAAYDERRPVLVRLTNDQPLPNDFEAESMSGIYLPEVIIDLERALSRLRQLSALVADDQGMSSLASAPDEQVDPAGQSGI